MPLPFLVGVALWGLVGGAVGYAIGSIIDEILDWFASNTEIDSEYGELIKEKLASGDYRVVGGIFNTHGVKTASEKWDVEKDDPDLKELMGRKKRIILEL